MDSYLSGCITWLAYFAIVFWPKTPDLIWDGMIKAMETHIGMRTK